MNTALSNTRDRTWNHSQAGILRSEPICVNVETESDNGNTTEAEIQLGIWVSAQYLKMKELLTHNSKSPTLPWLPLSIVKGELWYLLLASHSNGITTLWSRHLIADSSTLTGIYTVISVLQLLFQWSDTEHLSWFKNNTVCHDDSIAGSPRYSDTMMSLLYLLSIDMHPLATNYQNAQ